MKDKIIQISTYASDDKYGNEFKGAYALSSSGVVFDGSWGDGMFNWVRLPPIPMNGVTEGWGVYGPDGLIRVYVGMGAQDTAEQMASSHGAAAFSKGESTLYFADRVEIINTGSES